MSRFSKFICVLLMSFIAGAPQMSRAAAPDHWVGTWAASPMSAPNDKGVAGVTDETLRQIVHVSLGGSMVRVILTNEFGTDPLTIGAAHVALRATGSEIQLASANALTFNGQPGVMIPPGALAVSDPIALKLPPLTDLAISIFIPAQSIQLITQHSSASQTNYIVEGNHTGDKTLDGTKEFASWRFVKGVEVMASGSAGAVVTFGDSITDGAASTRNANARWPDVLAARLQADKKTAGIGVLNEGIGGNRLLHDITGPSALARFDRDVLSHSGVRYLIILEGINDIGRTAQPTKPGDGVTTPQLLFALQQLIDRAHAHGIKVFGATLTPFVGAKYASPEGQAMREAENAFIRSGKFDGIIDFDKATLDPANPTQFLPADESGDHLHPNDAGYKVMGNSIDLKLFEK
jgi:lysophospholipase L1-like esterase